MESNGDGGASKRLVAFQDVPEPEEMPTNSSSPQATKGTPNLKDVANNLLYAARFRNDAHDPFAARSIGRGVVLGLNEVIQMNPLESEAETHILRALEERDPTINPPRRPSLRDPSFLLSQVPDDASHRFEVLETATDSLQEPESNANTNNTNNTAPATATTPALPTSPRPKQPEPTTAQRKPQDIEQELFGLSTALRAIHAEDRGQGASSSLEGDMVGGPASLAGHNGPRSAADSLAQNAGILFRRNIRNDPSPVDVSNESTPEEDTAAQANNTKGNTTKAKKNWNKVRATVHTISPNSKKSDDPDVNIAQETESLDPELGKASPTASGGSNSNQTKDSKAPHHAYSPFFGNLNPPQVGKVVREVAKRTTSDLTNDLHIFREFFRPRHATVFTYCKSVLFYFIIPALAFAAILYYFVDNPHTGKRSHRTDGQKSKNGSISWWIIFLCIRQVVTLTIALAVQALVVDFFALRTRLTLRLCGPVVTLLIVQSKGWPFTFFCWGLLDFFMLSGPGPFARHWLYYQPWVGLFNDNNPSGNFVASKWNYRILAVAICVSFVVAVKRVAIGLYLGRRTFANYSRQLTQVMHAMFLISEIAALAKSQRNPMTKSFRFDARKSNTEAVFGWRERCLSEDEVDGAEQQDEANIPASAAPNLYDSSQAGGLSSSQRTLIKQALEDWEEPENVTASLPSTISVSAILQFRQALAFMSNDYPFSVSFGLADTRDACIQSSQLVYDKLLLHNSGEEILKFETISVLAKDPNGNIDEKKVKDLIRLFRPTREGHLSKIDFIRSVDSVYKSMRLLRASIAAAAKIDSAFESIFNVGFYVITACVALTILGFDPLTLFLSLSGVIVSFAFMIGSAASKYFEGVLFILVRRPFDIGDKIHVSDVNTTTSGDGSPCWTVDDVNLFTTTVIYGSTNERATMSNGSLAGSRIINANRSPKAVIYIRLKFGVNVPYEKVKIFTTVVEEFVKARPREWLALSNFRASNVELNLGYIEYVISAQHRESWQAVGAILNSKADLSSFCLEVMKKMDMGYTSPALPVSLSMTGTEQLTQMLESDNSNPSSTIGRSISEMFPVR